MIGRLHPPMIKIGFNIWAFRGWRRRMVCCLTAVLPLLDLGCATTFKYTSRQDPVSPAMARQPGLAIQTGEDDRPAEARQPGWAENAETIVAHALSEEVKKARRFQRVAIHTQAVTLKKYSRTVRFRVLKFECTDQADFLARTGQDILRHEVPHGEWIAESIPTQFAVEVEIEFAVFAGASRQPALLKTYSASRTLSINGYQGESPKIQQTSAALAEVLNEFIADLAKLRSDPPAA